MEITVELKYNWQSFLLGISFGIMAMSIWAHIMVKYIYPRRDKKIESQIDEIGKTTDTK